MNASQTSWKIPVDKKPPETEIFLAGVPKGKGQEMTIKYTVLKQGEVVKDEFHAGDELELATFIERFAKWVDPKGTLSIRNGRCHGHEDIAPKPIPAVCLVPFCKALGRLHVQSAVRI